MLLEFTKMNGAGNDFVLIDNRERKIELTADQVRHLCDRQRGVGGDGLFLLVPSESGKADWAWDFYNSDGTTADMCGNGARCFARFIHQVVGPNGDVTFETGAGVIKGSFEGDIVTVDLTEPHSLALNAKIETSQGELTVHSLNTGVPHAVIFVPDADQAMVQEIGREIRHHAHFAPSNGTNVNFTQELEPGFIRVRTYERGVEGETLACGTGVTAAAIITSELKGIAAPVKVQVQGGDILDVFFRKEGDRFLDVKLKGPADVAFQGKIEI
jgi:diaminopimelate epimerase